MFDVRWPESVTLAQREALNGHRAAVVWFTGLPASGKSSIARQAEVVFHRLACRTAMLDRDNVRNGVYADLGFSAEERRDGLWDIGELAKLLANAGLIVFAAFAAPTRADRDLIRRIVGADRFVEVQLVCPSFVCEERDITGLYRAARSGHVELAGVSSPYEPPVSPKVVLDTGAYSVDECVDRLVASLMPLLLLRREQGALRAG